MIHPRLQIIAAVAANGVIGSSGQLPWNLPDDMRFFMKTTLGHALIMGRRTFESLDMPLARRKIIVVSRTMASVPAGVQGAEGTEGVEHAGTLDEAIRLAEDSVWPIFIAGGSVLYEAALPIVGTMRLTELDQAFEGDTRFPPWDRSQWRLAESIRHEADAKHCTGFRFRTYQRIQ